MHKRRFTGCKRCFGSFEWKLEIANSYYLVRRSKRFKESRNIEGISDRMLSKVLKDLEQNKLVFRTVYDSFPPIVEYSATEHAKTLHIVIFALKEWGYFHRKKIIE